MQDENNLNNKPQTPIDVTNSRITSLEEEVKSLKKSNNWFTGLVVFGFMVLLIMVAMMLFDYWFSKNEISKERFEILKEQFNSKYCIIE